jgi:hypothetical protein
MLTNNKDVHNYEDMFLYTVQRGKITVKVTVSRNILDVNIPREIRVGEERLPVVAIAANAFKECKNITEVRIPDTVKELGDSVFMGCSELTDVKIGSGVEVLPQCAFALCKSLKTIEIPPQIRGIGVRCFAMCLSLESITLPVHTSVVMEKAFEGCATLQDVKYLSPKPMLSNSVFSGCHGIKSVTFNSKVSGLNLTAHKELACAEDFNLRYYDETEEGNTENSTDKFTGNFRDVKIFMPRNHKYGSRETGKPADSDFLGLFVKGFTWERYDVAYDTLNEDSRKVDTAAFRLSNMVELDKGIEKLYAKFLKKKFKLAVSHFIEHDDVEGLRVLAELGLLNHRNVKKYIPLADTDSLALEELQKIQLLEKRLKFE